MVVGVVALGSVLVAEVLSPEKRKNNLEKIIRIYIHGIVFHTPSIWIRIDFANLQPEGNSRSYMETTNTTMAGACQ